jgi:hypothetical protein
MGLALKFKVALGTLKVAFKTLKLIESLGN